MSSERMRGCHRNTLMVVVGTFLSLFIMLASLTVPVGAAEEVWELRVCADPLSLPFSNRDETGFENRIVEILADELDAVVTYDWHIFNPDLVNLRLRQGECDVLLGVPDGFSDLLTTVAYYRSPYVFVYRTDSDYAVESLDDPVLRTARIGLQNAGIPPHDALINRGITHNVSGAFGQRAGSSDRLGDLVVAVANEEVDIGIVWGPVGAYFARRQNTDLTVVPVSPEFEPPTTFMSVPMTMAVRPGDLALRDRLNVAIASRWAEIQEVLADYGVPLVPLPPPGVGLASANASDDDVLRIGIVLPTRTGIRSVSSSLYEIVGEAARMGALMAEGNFDRLAAMQGKEVQLFMASAPNAATARQAAARLLLIENVDALIGGIGDGQAEVLAQLAEHHRVPFLNVGSPNPALRRPADRFVFHVEASDEMYVDALVTAYADKGYRRWFVVYESTEDGARLLEQALATISQRVPDAHIVDAVSVDVEQPTYFNEIYAAQDEGADVILLLLHAVDQMAFLSQLTAVTSDMAVAPYPDPITQTRDFLGSAHVRYDVLDFGPRIALWDTALDTAEAADLNERFIGRWGKPMDPSAWAAYQAMGILYEAIIDAGVSDAEELVNYLADPANTFDLGKGQLLSFSSDERQLQQPLYVVALDPEGEWGINVWNQVDYAQVVGKVTPFSGLVVDE